jgi:POTRA domain, FtsQ-type
MARSIAAPAPPRRLGRGWPRPGLGLPGVLRAPARAAATAPATIWRRRRPRIALLASLIAVPLLGGGWLWLRNSSLVAVEHVRISGLAAVPDANTGAIAAALTSAARGMSTLDVKPAALRAAVARYPIVRAVRARARFPHGLDVEVVEQPPVALLQLGGVRTAVAADGVVLGPGYLSGSLPLAHAVQSSAGGSSSAGAPAAGSSAAAAAAATTTTTTTTVVPATGASSAAGQAAGASAGGAGAPATPTSRGGAPETVPAIGHSLRNGLLLAELSVLGAAPQALAHEVTDAYFGSRGLTIALRGGLLAYFGDATRARAKWLSLARVLADPGSAGAAYVDVRLPERPAAGFPPGTVPPDGGASATEASSGADPATAAELAAGLNAAVSGESSSGPSPAASAGSTSAATGGGGEAGAGEGAATGAEPGGGEAAESGSATGPPSAGG